MAALPLGQVIKDSLSFSFENILSGQPGDTHEVSENIHLSGNLRIGTDSKISGILSVNDILYNSNRPEGQEMISDIGNGIVTWGADLNLSIYGGKEIRFYNYDGTETYSSTAYAGIKSSTETGSGTSYTLTLPSSVNGKAGQYLMLSNNTGTLQWNSISSATSPLEECKCATTTNLSYSYNNGSDGIGATLTNSAGVVTIDGQSLTLTDRILVKDQTDKKHNGIYEVTTLGTISVGLVLTRVVDFHSASNIIQGKYVYVVNGTVNGNKSFQKFTSTPTTVGSDNIEFTQFSVGGVTSVTTGSGINGSGGDGSGAVTIDLDSSQTSISSLRNNSLIIGGNSQNNTIDFSTDDTIIFDIDNSEKFKIN